MADKAVPVTVQEILKRKKEGPKITALTAYDVTFARLLDEAGIDLILVGDSLGMVVQGHPNTLPVTFEESLYHTRCCARAVRRALLVTDMPFMSYQISPEQALTNAARCLKEGGAHAVKLEGGVEIASTVERLVRAGIPVMGHIGMQPMRVHQYGGYKLQGTIGDEQTAIRTDALAIAQAGAFALVLEKIPAALAQEITSLVPIPTIGIASGPHCDGQILVSYDMLGLTDQFKFRFVRRYLEGAQLVREAVRRYIEDVRNAQFPSQDESF